jgi:hypothetical protein
MDVTQVIQATLVAAGLALFFMPANRSRGGRAALSLMLFSGAGLVPMLRAGRAPTDVEQIAIVAIGLLAVALAVGAARRSKR